MESLSLGAAGRATVVLAALVLSGPVAAGADAEVTEWSSGSGTLAVPGGLTNVVGIAAGAVHSLALTADGRVVAWGENQSGQSTVPIGLTNVVGIAAGGSHSLALTTDGRVVAWGDGGSGQLKVPAGLSNAVAVAAGPRHSLALTAEGRVVAWGTQGQPALPVGLRNVVAIAAGSEHNLALTADGRVVAWGQFVRWVPGGPTTYSVPATVPGELERVRAIGIGAYGGQCLALTAEGTAVGWGWYYAGGGFDAPTDVPPSWTNIVAVAAGFTDCLALTAEGQVRNSAGSPVPAGLGNVVAVAAGGAHFLALSESPPGTAAPLGLGPRFLATSVDRPFQQQIRVRNGATGYGAAGLPSGLAFDPGTGLITGRATQSGTYPVTFSATNGVGSSAWQATLFVNESGPPTIVPSELVLAGLGSGFGHTVIAENPAESFDAVGLPAGLAIDAKSGVISGVPAEVGDFLVSLVASNRFGVATGTLRLRVSPVVAWGTILTPGPYPVFTPAQVPVPADWSNVVAIATGSSQMLAVTAEGGIRARGYYGDDKFLIPMTVPSGLSNIVATAGAEDFSAVLTASGRVIAWPLGFADLTKVVAISGGWALTEAGRVMSQYYATDDRAASPPGLDNVVAIADGGTHALALTAAGRVVGWGGNTSGQVTIPDALANVVAIATGGIPYSHGHSLALTADGRVVAWGSNNAGQTAVPAGLSNVVAIAAGSRFSLALTAEGRVVAWGVYYNGFKDVPMVVPPGLSNVVAIAAGPDFALALSGRAPGVAPPEAAGPRFLMAGVNLPFRHRLLARNGATLYGAAGLPPGLVLDPLTGLVSGRPTQPGRHSVVLTAANSLGSTSWTVTLVVYEAPASSSLGVALAHWGTEFRQEVPIDDGDESFEASGLPEGLRIDPQTGVISGVPVTFGDFEATVVTSNRQGLFSGSITLRVPSVVVWGNNLLDPATAPAGLGSVVAVSCGPDSSLALTSQGGVVTWGPGAARMIPVPTELGRVVGIAASSFAMTSAGRVAGLFGNGGVPSDFQNLVEIVSSRTYTLGLTTGGRVVASGWNNGQPIIVPASLSNVVAVAAGFDLNLALRSDGRVLSWGGNWVPVPVPGLSNVVAIAAGRSFGLALDSSGRVSAWGDDYSATQVPAGLSKVVAIAAGEVHALALTAEGRVVAWGWNRSHQTEVPAGLGRVVAIAAGGDQSVALLENPGLPSPDLGWTRELPEPALWGFGAPGISCQMLSAYALPGPWLPVGPVIFTNGMQSLRPIDVTRPSAFFRLMRK